MNEYDSSKMADVLRESHGLEQTSTLEEADVILLNTCSIRENAEQKVRARLQHFRSLKRQKPSLVIGVLGCMAERLKAKLLDQEQLVDLVVGHQMQVPFFQILERDKQKKHPTLKVDLIKKQELFMPLFHQQSRQLHKKEKQFLMF